jgi:hypothetical protein
MGEMRNELKILVGISQEKISVGRPRHPWEDNIKMDIREVGCEVLDWIVITC